MTEPTDGDDTTAARREPTGGVELAKLYGLAQSGARPPLLAYVRQLWQRRRFIVSFATARTIAQYSNARLGQLWQLLTPIFNVAVYYLVFGQLLHTSRGIPDFIAYLVIGVFMYNFTNLAVLTGVRSISEQLPLIRALHFPRATLPIASTVTQLQQLGFSMIIVCAVVLGTGQPVTVRWPLVIVVLALQFMFNMGLGLIVARIGATVTDLAQLVPFLLRTWMYTSGVFYSIALVGGGHGTWVKDVLQNNPLYIYMALVRHLMITDTKITRSAHQTEAAYHTAVQQAHQVMELPPHIWAFSIGWAVLFFVFGFVFFWHAEEKYGRG
jgi:teichoic acid transport system permease protein